MAKNSLTLQINSLEDGVMLDWRSKIAEAVKNEIETQVKGLKLTFEIETE